MDGSPGSAPLLTAPPSWCTGNRRTDRVARHSIDRPSEVAPPTAGRCAPCYRPRHDSTVDYGAEDVAAVFSRAAGVYDTIIPFFTRFGLGLVELANLRPGESVLDVGAGRGATLVPAAQRTGSSGRVVGVDLAEKMVRLLSTEVEQRGLTNVSVHRMDAEALALEPESFDVAISSFVLHLLRRPDAAAAGIHRVLRSNGRVAASAPTGAGPHWDFLFRLFQTYAPRAVRTIPMPFRADFDLVALLESAGFDVARTVDEEHEFVFTDEQAWWEWSWSAGMRALFESLSPCDLAALRHEAFTEVAALRTSNGVTLHQTARYVVARKRL